MKHLATYSGLIARFHAFGGRVAHQFGLGLVVLALGGVLATPARAAEIGDRVWLDLNDNGAQDVGEPGMTNVTVRLWDSNTNFLSVTLTDTNGIYRFPGLAAGSYMIEAVPPVGYSLASQNATNDTIDSDVSETNGFSDMVSVAANQTNNTVDAGMVRLTAGMTLVKLAVPAPNNEVLYTNVGATVVYTFHLSNTGNTDLTSIFVTDDRIGIVGELPSPGVLRPGLSLTFTTEVVITESVTNLGEAVATPTRKGQPIAGFEDVIAQDTAVVVVCSAPTMICATDVTVECSANLSTNALGFPSLLSNDCNCSVLSISSTDTIVSGSCPNSYTILRAFTVNDVCGFQQFCTQVITVVDTTRPVLSGVPTNRTVECSAIPAPPNVTATDNCDTNLAPVFFSETTNAGGCANSYTLVRIWSAQDACSNFVAATQTLLVVDTTAPVLSGVPANTNVSCDAIPRPATVTASDNCDTNLAPVAFVETTNAGACANSFVLVRIWSAQDACSNLVAATQLVTVADTTAPVLDGVPTNVTAQCDNIPGIPPVTATDNCDTNLAPVLFSQTTNAGACANSFVLVRVWSARDACSNFVAATQLVSVIDTTAPVLSGVPTNVTVECDAIPGPDRVTATDNCDTNLAPVFFSESTNAGACANSFVLVRVWSAQDACSNFVAATQLVSVIDTSAPVLSGVPTNTSAECSAIPTPVTVTATDACDRALAPVTFTETTNAGDCANSYTLVRVWSASDACSNAVAATQLIFVVDTTAPVLFGVPADTNVQCDAVPAAATVTATDNCSSNPVPVTLVETPVTGRCANSYTLVRVWTALDACSNSVAATQVVTVVDTVSPLIVSTPADLQIDCLTQIPPADPLSIVASDNCTATQNLLIAVTASTNTGTGVPGDELVVTYVYTVTDECGNFSQSTQLVTQACSPSYVLSKELLSPTNGPAQTGTVVTFRICVTNTGDVVLDTVQIDDSYDGSVLLFQTSSLPLSLGPQAPVGPGAPWLIRWDNIGPVLPGGVACVTVDFLALTNTAPGETTNVAISTVSTYGYPLPPQTSSAPVTTYVILGLVEARNISGQGAVYWTTESETGTAGFELYRRDPASGGWIRVGSFVASSADAQGSGEYLVVDAGVAAGRKATYRIVEVDVHGRRSSFGPYDLVIPKTASLQTLAKNDGSTVIDLTGAAAAPSTVVTPSATPVSAIKVYVGSEGLYEIGVTNLASAFGRTVADLRTALAAGLLAVENRGQPVRAIASSNTLSFYARSFRSTGSDQNAYWIRYGMALTTMPVKPVVPTAPQAGASYPTTAAFEQNVLPKPDLFQNRASDFWMWRRLAVSSPTAQVFSCLFNLSGFVTSPDASVTLRLKGGQATVTHRATVSLNGAAIGTITFSGLDAVERTLPVTNLAATGNVMTVTATGDDMSVFCVDGFTVAYRRAMTAAGNEALIPTDGAGVVCIAGFTAAAIAAFDVSDAAAPQLLSGTAIGGGSGNYSASFIGEPALKRIYAIAGTGRSAISIVPDTPSNLKAATNRAEYLIIAASSLKQSAQQLADYRSGRGLVSKVVDVEDVYDEFLFGIRDGLAIRNFLNYASKYWATPPRYVVLVGQGSYDYKNYLGYGDSTVPSLLVSTEHGLQVSDALYSDSNGDGRFETAVGRIPAASATEVVRAVAKIKRYDAGGSWRSQAVALADNGDRGGNFAKDSDTYAVPHLRKLATKKLYLPSSSTQDIASVKSQLITALNSGCGLLTYFGHSTQYRFAGEYLLSRSDAENLTNASTPPLVAALTCLMGDIGTPGLVSLGETMIVSSNGAACVIGAGSQVYNGHSRQLAAMLLSNVYEQNIGRIGDALLLAANQAVAGGMPDLCHSYNLLGDPAMEMRNLGNSPMPSAIANNDFNADGQADLGLFQPSSGTWYVLGSGASNTAMSLQWGSASATPVAADYDGDGITDFAVFYPLAGSWYILPSTTGQGVTRNWGWFETIPVPADYDGDGAADLAVFHPSTGNWYIQGSFSNTSTTIQFGWSGTTPVPADYDGDLVADIAVYHASSGVWYIARSSDGAVRSVNWGWNAAMPVQGDYDGDGLADVAVYHLVAGDWYIKRSSDNTTRQFNWGWNTAYPVPADYDGDKITDAAVFSPSAGSWYIKQSASGQNRTVTWGSSQMTPVLLQYQINRRFFSIP